MTGSRWTLMMVAAAVLLAGTATAAKLMTEQFEYGAGTLTAVSGATWTAHSGAGTNSEQVVGTSISYPGLTNVYGGSVTFLATGEDVNRAGFSVPGTGNGETAYYSLVVNIATAQATGDYFFHFVNGLITTNAFRGRLFVRSSGAGYNLGIRYSSGDTIQWDSNVLTFGTPVFVVVKLTSNSGAPNDTAALFINPAIGGGEPAPNVIATNTVAAADDFTDLDLVAIRQGSSTAAATGSLDSIRVGTTWADVVAAAVPVTVSGFSIE